MSELQFEVLPDDRRRLLRDVAYHVPHIGAVQVRAGYVTDGASIPRWAWSIVGHPLTSDFALPALIHDYLCDAAAAESDYGLRVIADALFFRALAETGVGYVRRAVMYAAVRCWGRYTYSPRQ